MNINKFSIKSLFILSILLFIISCDSNELTREKAKEIIVMDKNYPKSATYNFSHGTIRMDKQEMDGYKTLINAGLINIKILETEKWNMGYAKFLVLVSLTEQANDYVEGSTTQRSTNYKSKAYYVYKTPVKIFDQLFNEITGIRVNDESNSAQVEYTEERTNYTPFHDFLRARYGPQVYKKPTLIERDADLALYDDGWRMNN